MALSAIMLSAVLLLGDTDCSGNETIRDAQLIAQYDAGLWNGKQEGCPDVGQWVGVKGWPFFIRWGDWDRNGRVNENDVQSTLERITEVSPPLHEKRIWFR